MDLPSDWVQIEAAGTFSFWLPPDLAEVSTRGIDSVVRRWESEDLTALMDYGRFSDPLTEYSAQKSYQETSEQIAGHAARIVSFRQDDGWAFTAVHFPNLGSNASGHTLKLTLVVKSSPQLSQDVPLQIVRSVSFEIGEEG